MIDSLECRYRGYLTPEQERALPIQPGMKVVIPKGTRIRTMDPKHPVKIAKRSYTITVRGLCPGSGISVERRSTGWVSYYPRAIDAVLSEEYASSKIDEVEEWLIPTDDEDRFLLPTSNPAVRWSGSGYYWHEADINDLLEANGL